MTILEGLFESKFKIQKFEIHPVEKDNNDRLV